MGQWSNILKNTVALALPSVLNPFVSLALVLLISRYMGVRGLGQYSLIFSYIGIFKTLASLGLGDLITREVAKKPEQVHDYFLNASAFGTVSGALALFSMDVIMVVMDYDREVIAASFIFSFSLLFSTTIYYMDAIFRSFGKAEYIALTYTPENLVRVAVCVGLLLGGYGIVEIFSAILATRIFAFFLMLVFYVRVFGRPRWRFDREIWTDMAKKAPAFAGIVLFSTIHLSIDQIMLSKLKSIESVGLYSASGRLLEICNTIPVAFAGALLPFFTRAFVDGIDSLRKICMSAVRYSFLITFPAAIGTAVLADQFIVLIYGHKFAESAGLLRLQIFSFIPFSMVFVLAQVLIATDNQKVDLHINMVAAAVSFVLNFALIPVLGEYGAVAATFSSIMVFNQLQYMYIKKRLFPVSIYSLGGKYAAASLGMGVVTYLLRDWNLFLNIVISAVAYAGLLFVMKALSPEEIRLLRRIIGR
ncbi:MAG: flippase [Pseudomonadota bacterium]